MTKAKAKTRRFCDKCHSLQNSGQPCPLALERIHAMQAEANSRQKNANIDVSQGCDWYINSAEYDYCFWNLAKELDGSPMSDREICQFLGISAAQLKETYLSAINKLRQIQESAFMQDFAESVLDRSNAHHEDQTVYLPESFRIAVERSEEDEEEEEEKSPVDEIIDDYDRKIRKGFGMPMHRDGKKIDLYGLYSKKTLQKIGKRKKRAKKDEDDSAE